VTKLMLSKCKALGSNSSTAKEKKNPGKIRAK
jgi:hypothetical protein